MKHTLTIAFSTHYVWNDDIKAKVIRYFDKSTFDHALLILDEKTVYHAIGTGVTQEPIETFIKRRRIMDGFQIDLTDLQFERLKAFMEGSEGKEYSRAQLFGILLAKFVKVESVIFLNGTKKYICSEFVALCLQYIFDIKLADVLDLVTPRELRDTMLTIPMFKRMTNLQRLAFGASA